MIVGQRCKPILLIAMLVIIVFSLVYFVAVRQHETPVPRAPMHQE